MATSGGSGLGIDLKWTVAMVLVLLGWAVNIGVIRQQVYQNKADIDAHDSKGYHEGVRVLVDANGDRIRSLEIRQERIEVKLERILSAIERLDK